MTTCRIYQMPDVNKAVFECEVHKLQEEMQRDFDYYIAQRVAEQLKNSGLISIDEFNKLTQLNRRTFLPMNVEILPKIC